MKNKFKINLFGIYALFLVIVFASLTLIQKNNNALPFFYKDYPTYKINGKQDFDASSESLVLNRIDFATLSKEYKYKFNLWRINNDVRYFGDYKDGKTYNKEHLTTREYLSDGSPYRSQIGAQSFFWVQLSSILNQKHGDYRALKGVAVLLFSICAAAILTWVYINFGMASSLVGLLVVVLSTGVNIFAESLYWSIWQIFLPLAVVCVLDALEIENIYAVFFGTFMAFLFKFLSGYEFITMIVFAAMTPYVWDFFINKNSAALARTIYVGLSSVAAFLVSLVIYNAFYLTDFQSSGFDNIYSRSGSWSLKNISALGISPWVQSGKFFIMNFMDVNGYGMPLIVFLVVILATIFFARNKIGFKEFNFIGFLFLGSVSWLIVQPGHVLFHPRYAALVFFIPFGLFAPSFIVGLYFTQDKSRKAVSE